ncbi:MAG: hypothetical protein IKE16_07160, partial [Solobacterium sp.]|nr:hypothetical protein [Solobacterium sp.]
PKAAEYKEEIRVIFTLWFLPLFYLPLKPCRHGKERQKSQPDLCAVQSDICTWKEKQREKQQKHRRKNAISKAQGDGFRTWTNEALIIYREELRHKIHEIRRQQREAVPGRQRLDSN